MMRQSDNLKTTSKSRKTLFWIFQITLLSTMVLISQVGCDTGAYEKRILERQDELIYGDEEEADDSVSQVPRIKAIA